jgi:hypothetical protein
LGGDVTCARISLHLRAPPLPPPFFSFSLYLTKIIENSVIYASFLVGQEEGAVVVEGVDDTVGASERADGS